MKESLLIIIGGILGLCVLYVAAKLVTTGILNAIDQHRKRREDVKEK